MRSLCLEYSKSSFPRWFPSPPDLGHLSPESGREAQPYLSMLMAQRFRMLAVHIMTSRVTKTSQQTRLKFQTPPVTWVSETRMLVFPPSEETTTHSTLPPSLGCPAQTQTCPPCWYNIITKGRHQGTVRLPKTGRPRKDKSTEC